MENKNVPKKAATQNENTASASTVKVVPKAEYEQMIAANMSLKAMADKTGLKAYHVRKQLEAHGLKTASMAGPRVKMTDALIVADAIEMLGGDANAASVAVATDLDPAIVKKTIKMMQKEGLLVEAYVMVKKSKPVVAE